MTNNYSDYANKTRSSKIVLCHVEPKQRLSVFSLDSGNIYKKSVNYFVVDVSEDLTSLTKASNSSLSSGEWYYDPLTGELYVNTTDDSDPKTKKIIVTYRLFYSNRSIDLPYDLESGVDVNYDGRLLSNSPISKELDDEQIGIVLETSTNINFENTDSHFDEFYDSLIFENKSVKIWSWSEIIPLSEKRKLFDGIIEDKRFSDSKFSIRCKDFLYTLRKPLNYNNYTTSDGEIPEQFLFKPKRRIFGEVNQVQCVPVDATLDGFQLSGTSSVFAGDLTTLVGSGTSFLDELSGGDKIIYEQNGVTYNQTVSSVTSNTEAVFEDDFEISFSNKTINNKPEIPYRLKNREFNICGHKLREVSATITSVSQSNRFAVDDASEFFAGDVVFINGESSIIRRVSGNNIVLRTNLDSGAPSVSDLMTKNPVKRVFVNGDEIVLNRDYVVSNDNEKCNLVFDNLLEFNIAPIKDLESSLTFTNSSRVVSVDSGDPRTEINIRDWVVSGDDGHNVYYEVLSVSETEIVLRTEYDGATNTSIGKVKNLKLIDDDSIVTVNCIGQELDSSWLKNASNVVRSLMINECNFSNINESSFTQSAIDSDAILSLVTPERLGGKPESVRSIVTKINESVFGSLTIDQDFNIKYSILSNDLPTELTEIKDDDVISKTPRISSRNNIFLKTNSQYSFFSDKFNGEDSFKLYEYESDFVSNIIGSTDEQTKELYLFNDNDAETITQRYAYYSSLSQSIVSFKGGLSLTNYGLNDVVLINFDRLYKRFSNSDNRKIGIVNKYSSNGNTVDLTINDLSNTFNRTGNIAANDALDFTSASDDEKIKYGYIVDNDTLTPDVTSDLETYGNSIG